MTIRAPRRASKPFFTRPAIHWTSYTTPLKSVFICSSSTPPGGVHGMYGYYAAQAVLRSK